jgi:molybdopterin/thiamine biosynthesis adenylyltransferase
MNMTAIQQKRYYRSILLPEVGESGQKKLLQSSVLIVGAGGLGSPAALYLAAAGVGNIGLIDADNVDLSNLQRQIIHGTQDIGQPKVISAADSIRRLNPDIHTQTWQKNLTSDNARDILKDYQFVIDATDNFSAKFLIAEACHTMNKAYVHAGILAFAGQIMTVIPGQTACYRCIFRDPPPENMDAVPAGVLGVLPAVVGSIQATEAVKYLLGIGKLLTNTLLVYDALDMSFRKVELTQDQTCPVCGNQKG